ncbi:MAG TPA: hypothetical protein P5228_05255 [Bacteroidales bacterium]|nr:hypothetical protein [Bacteroidales bacterium]HRZ48428.1 hypothetical protein [Bacteroidales bacterium]
MKIKILVLTMILIISGYRSSGQYSTLRIQDFDTLQTPAWPFTLTSGTLEFANGNSPSNALPANSPYGINGSWAWKQEGQSGGVVLTFDNVNIAGYDTVYITFRVAAFANTGSNGVDELDHVTTAVSINNGVNWYDQVKINGASGGNSSWAYTGTGIASRVFSTSAVTVFAPAASGFDPAGYSTVLIKVPNTTNQVRLKITSRSSVNTERYCIDNVEIKVANSKCDAGITRFVSPQSSGCSGNQPVVAMLKNFGPGFLNNTTMKWSHNNVSQTDYLWNGNLPPGDSVNVTIGIFSFSGGTNNHLKAWVHMPNNQPDTMNLNDTAWNNNIQINPSPTITPAQSTLNGCQGDTILISGTLTGTPPFTVVLSDGSGNSTYTIPSGNLFNQPFTPATSKTYTFVQIGDGTGCTSNPSVTVQVNISQAPPAVITPSGSTAICTGDSTILLASIGLNFSYLWYKNGVQIPGAVNYFYTVKSGGAYTVKVTNPGGCSALSAPITIFVHPLPVVFLGNDTNIVPTASVNLNAGAGFTSYLWSTGALTQAVQIDSSGTGLGTKTVWVEVSDNYGCKGSDTIKIQFVFNPGTLEEYDDTNIAVFPNPSEGRFMISLPDPEIGIISTELYYPDGRTAGCRTTESHGRLNEYHFDCTTLPAGLYLVLIKTESGQLVKKITIIR